MNVPLTMGRKPRMGHELGAREPIRFYVQIKDEEDRVMLIIPRRFHEVMKQWLVIRLLRIVRLSAMKWCEFCFQIQNFEGHMVLGGGWNFFCDRHKVVPGDILVIRISGLGLKVQIYNHKRST